MQKIVRAPPEKLELTTVFVYPFDFKWEEPVYRRFELSQRLVEQALRHNGGQFAFFGPSEFKVLRANDNGAWVASTALPLLISSGSRSDQGVIIRLWAERRKNSSVHQAFDTKGKGKGTTSTEETSYLGHLDVVHPASRTVLIEVSSEVTVNPFTTEPGEDDADPTQALTRLMGTLLKEALRLLADQAIDRPVRPELGLTLALTPKATVSYSEEGKPSTQIELEAEDLVARELFVQNRAKFLAPFLSETELPKVAKMPIGTYVVAARSGSKVGPGDLVLSIDGAPALPQSLARLRFSQVPAQLRVLKASGQTVDLVFP